MNKSMKPRAQAGAALPLTEEQKKKAIAMKIIQKRNSYAEAILFNLCHGSRRPLFRCTRKRMVEASVDMANKLMEALNPGINIMPDEPEQEKPEDSTSVATEEVVSETDKAE